MPVPTSTTAGVTLTDQLERRPVTTGIIMMMWAVGHVAAAPREPLTRKPASPET